MNLIYLYNFAFLYILGGFYMPYNKNNILRVATYIRVSTLKDD